MINIAVLKDFSRVRKFLKGSVITAEGDSSELFVVLKGEAAFCRNYRLQNREWVSRAGPGELFGEASMLLGMPMPVTAVAVTDVIALTVRKADAADFFREEPDMALELMKALCARQEPGAPAPGAAAARVPEPEPEQRPASASPAPVQTAPQPPLAAGFSLFPEGHAGYDLPLDRDDAAFLMDSGYTCPACRKEFRARRVRESRLVSAGVDRDMRHRYRGVEPLYHDVITCPHCLYSALVEHFNSPDHVRPELLRELQAVKAACTVVFDTARNPASVFAGYYLAIFCAPKCFANSQITTAKLYMKLMRLYQDCGDAAMEAQSARLALDAYLHVYLNEQGNPAQDQQLCLVLGELYFKLGDLRNARDYFFKAKTSREGSPVLKTQAENRLQDIRAAEAGES